MSREVYNGLTTTLLFGSLVALGLAAAYLIAGIVGWRGPYRKQRLFRFGICLAAFPICVAVQQSLLYHVYLPRLGRATKRIIKERHYASSIVQVGDQAPSFSLTDTDGRDFVLDDLRGKVILVNFFATWCGPCLLELPHVQEIWDKHHNNSQFALIVIGREEATEIVSEFRLKQGYTFQMAPDPERIAYSLYASELIPRTYLIGADGKICFSSAGFDEEELAALKSEVARQLRSIR
ncbi:TlpA family protein disulfide reductase [Schlesneria sp. T3-172]|uniref:TlpA family protein disulfide reductase n=1 Tax=Schlesneria sphaerica TaxID=3373610 RepID=UPI0037C7D958